MTSAKSSDLHSLSPEEQERLLSALGFESDRIMLKVLLEAHRPLEDLLEAKVSDLDLDRGHLRLRRGGERGGEAKRDEEGIEGERRGEGRKDDEPEVEEIPLSPELLRALIEHLETHPSKVHLFEGRCGKPVGPKWFRCAIEPVVEKLGLSKGYAAGISSGTDRK